MNNTQNLGENGAWAGRPDYELFPKPLLLFFHVALIGFFSWIIFNTFSLFHLNGTPMKNNDCLYISWQVDTTTRTDFFYLGKDYIFEKMSTRNFLSESITYIFNISFIIVLTFYIVRRAKNIQNIRSFRSDSLEISITSYIQWWTKSFDQLVQAIKSGQ